MAESPIPHPPAAAPPASTGTLFIVSAPSGAGKTSLVRALLARDPALKLSVSYTTRAPRPGEIAGRDYHFVDHAVFESMIANGAFVEFAKVFGNGYGTAEATLRDTLAGGEDLLLEIDWQGARQVRRRLPRPVSVFLIPPPLQALQQRLRGRGQDSEETIARRMTQARSELSHFDEYDYLIVNDDFDRALSDLGMVVGAERLRRLRQQHRHRGALSAMLVPAPTLSV
jgi:guanylate kinase